MAPDRLDAATTASCPRVCCLSHRTCLTESLSTADGTGLSTWSSVLGSELFRTALWRTIQIAVASTLGCLILGTFLALVLAFVPFAGSKVVGAIDRHGARPAVFPDHAGVHVPVRDSRRRQRLDRPHHRRCERPLNFLNTPFGVIAAEITFFTPFVVRPLLAAFTQIPREQLDVAASLGASPVRVLRQVVMPEAWPALLAGGSLVLLMTLNEFGIVLFTGGAKDVVTLPVLIYTRGIVTFDLPGAAVIATVQVALSLGLYCLYRFTFNRLMGGSRAAVDTKL